MTGGHGECDQSGLVSSRSGASLNMIILCPSQPTPLPLIASAVASHFESPSPYMIYSATFLRLETLASLWTLENVFPPVDSSFPEICHGGGRNFTEI